MRQVRKRGRARSRIDCFQNGLLELLKMAAATTLDAELVLVGGVAGKRGWFMQIGSGKLWLHFRDMQLD